jgi:hypothetical protein
MKYINCSDPSGKEVISTSEVSKNDIFPLNDIQKRESRIVNIKYQILYAILTILISSQSFFYLSCTSGSANKHAIIFAAFAEDEEQLYHTLVLAESIRTFAGRYKDAPIWIYVPERLIEMENRMHQKFDSLDVDIKTSQVPDAALVFYFSRKVFASAKAEAEADGNAEILAWLDEDTIILKEPKEFILRKDIHLGYRPVMHKNIGLLYSEPLDAFWSRAYSKLSVREESVFPMVTAADQDTIRPYFNAGCLIVRPERGLLRKWAENYPFLYADPVFIDMSRNEIYKRIFLHQAVLTGTILTFIQRDEMQELPQAYNYPIFFDVMYGAKKEFGSIRDVVTLRYDVYFRKPDPGWHKKLEGPEDVIEWLKERLPDDKTKG